MRNLNFLRYVAVLVLAVFVLEGCGSPSSTMRSGTAGTVRLQGVTMADLQVNVFTDDSVAPQRVAYGVSNPHGDYHLATDDGKGPATLKPGRYRIALESVAPEPIPIPADYTDPLKTPLKIVWPMSDNKLAVVVD